MLGVFAEFEREIIRERVTVGIARAKVKGTRSGKAIGRPFALDPVTCRKVRAAYAKGDGLRPLAKQFGVSIMTVRKALKLQLRSIV
jgi:DNA invertase Pin-like site-specific DNA recombinase